MDGRDVSGEEGMSEPCDWTPRGADLQVWPRGGQVDLAGSAGVEAPAVLSGRAALSVGGLFERGVMRRSEPDSEKDELL